MTWMVEPFGGFDSISFASDEGCVKHCTCVGGLAVCTCVGGLIIIPPEK